MDEARRPNPIDIRVGQNLRLLRKRQNVSQTVLADAVGLTFQQVQKYERGVNRVSASKLFELARFLEVPVAHLFDGLEGQTEHSEEPLPSEAYNFLATPEGLEFASIISKITRPALRRRLLDLLKEFVRD